MSLLSQFSRYSLLNIFEYNIKYFMTETIFSASFSTCYCYLPRIIKLLAFIFHLTEIIISGKGCILFPILISNFIYISFDQKLYL